MTARIHDNRTDPQWRERGIGATADGALCSRRNLKRPMRGGGTVKGRWYGACCKPVKVTPK